MTFEPIRKQRVPDQVAGAIREAILRGDYAAGDPLPSERDLATRFGVNRSSVREALHRLEAWRLIEIRQGGATLVQDVLASAGLQLLPYLVAPGGAPDVRFVRELQEIRVLLMGWSARQAARGADEASLGRLAALLGELGDPRASEAALRRADMAFYQELVGMTGNRVLGLLANAIGQVYLEHPSLFLQIHRPGRFDVRHHLEVFEALTRGDGEAAAAAMAAYARTAEALLPSGDGMEGGAA